MVDKSNINKIVKCLKRNYNLALTLYILSETPCYIEEVSKELSISIYKAKGYIHYLKQHKLIQKLNVNLLGVDQNEDELVKEFYPVIIKKRDKIASSLSALCPSKDREVLKNIKFYFATEKGHEILGDINISKLLSR